VDESGLPIREQALLFGKSRSLVGIIADPPERPTDTELPAFVLLNAGLVHRVGPHRIFVRLARKLAALGFLVMRFDHSGIGDSKARHDNLPFEESAVRETQEAMDCLNSLRAAKRFVVVGLCSGTLTSFRTACCDPRVAGIVLLNGLLESPEQINEETAAYVVKQKIARSFWHNKLFQPESWLRFIKGKANYRRIIEIAADQLSNFVTRGTTGFPGPVAGHLRSLVDRGVKLLFVYSEGTGVLEYFRLSLANPVAKLGANKNARVEVMKADHSFTLLQQQEELLKVICGWARTTDWVS